MPQTILILGASYAGLNIAHKLLKHTLPHVPDLRVILINPSPKFYWNMAAVRAIIPGLIPDSHLFHDIPSNFSSYTAKNFEFVLGTAEKVDVEGNRVEVRTESGARSFEYTHLVVATGSRGNQGMPWKLADSLDETLEDLHSLQERVVKAKTIVVGGGGGTGTETVAELGFEYGKTKEITIITSGSTLLAGNMTEAINLSAEKELEKLNINIIRNTRIESTTLLPTGQTQLNLSTGPPLTCDLYLPTTGLSPNTSFLPSHLLNPQGLITVSPTLLVTSTNNIYAVGDCSALQRSGWMITEAQASHLFKSLDGQLRKGQKALVYKLPERDMMAVALGRSRGTGMAMGMKLPSLVVHYAKGRTLGVQLAKGFVAGKGL